MLFNKMIAVVVPAYNEEKQIGSVLATIPDFVDHIIVVNDCSKDKTADVVLSHIREDRGIGKAIRPDDAQNYGNQCDRAETLLKEKQQSDLQHYVPSEIVNVRSETDRISLINHLKNGGVGAAIATWILWCPQLTTDLRLQ
jgi:glycosyltransferase involved in cell wall biosynthesis